MRDRQAGIRMNQEQSLYIIPTGRGFTCLGFDVCIEQVRGYQESLGLPLSTLPPRGSLAMYRYYEGLLKLLESRYLDTGERCYSELTPQLMGFEGRRVEVVEESGTRRRFWVGRSTGFVPIHLEVARRNSSGGCGVTGAPFVSVKVIG